MSAIVAHLEGTYLKVGWSLVNSDMKLCLCGSLRVMGVWMILLSFVKWTGNKTLALLPVVWLCYKWIVNWKFLQQPRISQNYLFKDEKRDECHGIWIKLVKEDDSITLAMKYPIIFIHVIHPYIFPELLWTSVVLNVYYILRVFRASGVHYCNINSIEDFAQGFKSGLDDITLKGNAGVLI